ncbi:hypothetical protein DNH61_04845 [Paenibacillus sambharensis]|uniref:Uncharacterized protein n=1 Tax=Paenibacillus sambharensis TaxID=1803190 RepID=A0A2W1LZS9_9BACL|nr:hypothetical protein [Paenibacillus sambharensis]PZD96977.1 hypothetical protein DNH61_04845 [Paenibacillus sambharensis]
MSRIIEPKEKLIFRDKEKNERVLDHILDIRKFEIELYWKRATYFWTFIAAVFAGYFLVSSKNDYTNKELYEVQFLISCIGLVFSVAWYLVNRGSKYWQENWEALVGELEDESLGPLYKTTIATSNRSDFWNLVGRYSFSVSKINIILSLFVCVIWILLASKSLSSYFERFELFDGMNLLLILLISSLFIFFFFKYGTTRKENRKQEFIDRGYSK